MTTVREALEKAGLLEGGVIGARVGDRVLDLHSPVPADAGQLQPVKSGDDSPDALAILRHTTAHVMADAVQRLFPGTKVTIGPSVDDGFYYDFDRPEGAFADADLARIEEEMRSVLAEKSPLVREEVSRGEAMKLFAGLGESYKLQLLSAIPEGDAITLYRHGKWTDLCRGPHLPGIGSISVFKLMKVAGAYWRGDERNPMLSRIYGTAFFDKKSLAAHLKRLEEAAKRDHRKLGRDLDLFSFDQDVGGGMVLWHVRGAYVRYRIEEFWRKAHLKNGYELLFSPHVGRDELWTRSGHLEYYKENMFAPMEMEGGSYRMKPMNCPFHISVYRSRRRSYREFPMRWGELGTVYRYERSGQLHGLLRVRSFTQDDAHLFCRMDQMEQEIIDVVRFSMWALGAFGFQDLAIRLATRPPQHIGDEATWDLCEDALRKALDTVGVKYEVDKGGGTFYGPKIDTDVRDVLGRPWQCATVQVDLNLPERFDLTYTAEDGKAHRPLMLHRTLLGSMERFMGVLIEHYAGAFPAWLAPELVVVMNVTDRQESYAIEIADRMKAAGLRARADTRTDKLGAKIRDARNDRVPYQAVVGDREMEAGKVALRGRDEGEMEPMDVGGAVEYLMARAAEPEIPIIVGRRSPRGEQA